MSVSEAPWDGSASNYKDATAYCDACLVDDNPAGQDKVKSLCSLPIKTPTGVVSRAGVHAAAARLNQVKTSPANKKAAAKKLLRAYVELKEEAPDSIKSLARG